MKRALLIWLTLLLVSSVAWAGLDFGIPLYSGCKWKAARNVKEEGLPATLLESQFFKGAKGGDLADYYVAELKKRGWKVVGPAGGTTSWTVTGTRQNKACRVYFTANQDYATDSPPNPRGAHFKIYHFNSIPDSMKE